MASCTVEVFTKGVWVRAGEIHVRDERAGYAGAGRFEYDLDYLESWSEALGAFDARAVSCRYPLAYDLRDEEQWPAFLLDIIPSGAARRFWERELGVPNNSGSESLCSLCAGASGAGGRSRGRGRLPPSSAPLRRAGVASDLEEAS